MKESESRRLLLTSRKGIGPGAGFRTRQPCHLGGKSGSFQISPLRPRQLHAEARTWSERTGSAKKVLEDTEKVCLDLHALRENTSAGSRKPHNSG